MCEDAGSISVTVGLLNGTLARRINDVVEDSEFIIVSLVSADRAAMFNPTTTRIRIA